MKVIRIMSLCLVLLMTLSVFGGCGKDEDAQSDTASVGLSTVDVSFVTSDGEAFFSIVRPSDASDDVTACAMRVFKKYKESFSVLPKNTSDFDGAAGPEILIGNCDRESTAVAKAELEAKGKGRVNEYIICTVGEDIVIYAEEETALINAVDYFVETYFGSSTVAGGIYQLYTNTDGYENISVLGNDKVSEFKIVRPIYNISYITQIEIDALHDELFTKTGFDVEIVEDRIASKTGSSTGGTLERSEVGEYEIIVGNCDRDGVNTITDNNEYEIRTDGNKIYLNGGSPAATAMAVSEFSKILINNKAFTANDAVLSGDYGSVIGGYDTATQYTLTWSDDFEGTEIDSSKWYVAWNATAYKPADGGKPCYRGNSTLKNNYVKDGKLYLEALETDDGYYGGLLHNQGIMQYRYGYTEISTLHPKGEGFWEALYTMSAVSADCTNNVDAYFAGADDHRIYYSETDIDESKGNGGDWAWTHVHAWPTRLTRDLLELAADEKGNINPGHVTNALDDRGFWMDFHTFGYEWLDNKSVRFIVDGKERHVQELDGPELQDAFSQAVFMRLGLAVGTSTAPVTATEQEWKETNKYIIDYIHVYQLKGHEFYINDNGWEKIVIA